MGNMPISAVRSLRLVPKHEPPQQLNGPSAVLLWGCMQITSTILKGKTQQCASHVSIYLLFFFFLTKSHPDSVGQYII